MARAKLSSGLGLLAAGCILAVSGSAFAHAYVMTPPPRDIANLDLNARAHKSGPCGGIPRTGKPTQYAVGATIQVKWEETIGHQGCYQVGFSPANDANFVTLLQVDDPAGMLGTPITQNVTLPAGVSCKACTLVVRQLMNNGPCVGNPMDPATSAAGTYYSCADICVGTECADAGAPDAGPDATANPDGGPTTTPTDGGGKTVPPNEDEPGTTGARNLRSGAGDDGCSVGFGATSSMTFAAAAGLVSIAILRRRKRRH